MAERKRIKTYREAVEAAAAGDLSRSFRKLEALGAIVECDSVGQNERLTNAYLEIAKSGESAIVISQTRAEVRAVNDAIREQLRDRGLLAGDESAVTALEQVDLTEAQKLDLRHYPSGSVVVFNRDFRNCTRGEHGKIIGLTVRHLVIEVADRVRQIPRKDLGKITVCLPQVLRLSIGDKLQLKANGRTLDGRKIANGEIVSVAKISEDGRSRPVLRFGRAGRVKCTAMVCDDLAWPKEHPNFHA